MANAKNLEIKATVLITSTGDVSISVGKVNNFADIMQVAITDSVATVDNDSAAALRDYPTGKEVSPTLTFTPALLQDDNWIINLTFSNAAASEVLTFSFTGYQDSTADTGYVVDSSLKVSKAL